MQAHEPLQSFLDFLRQVGHNARTRTSAIFLGQLGHTQGPSSKAATRGILIWRTKEQKIEEAHSFAVVWGREARNQRSS